MRNIEAKIRKNVPPPQDNRFRWKPFLDKMDVGDSFILPKDAGKYARQSINAYGRMHDKKFMVREDGNDNKICWRTE